MTNQPPKEEIQVTANLETTEDTARAADLFSRILRAVEEETARQERERK